MVRQSSPTLLGITRFHFSPKGKLFASDGGSINSDSFAMPCKKFEG